MSKTLNDSSKNCAAEHLNETGGLQVAKQPDRIKEHQHTSPDVGLLAFSAIFQANYPIRHALIKLKMNWLISALLYKPRNKSHSFYPFSLFNIIPTLLFSFSLSRLFQKYILCKKLLIKFSLFIFLIADYPLISHQTR